MRRNILALAPRVSTHPTHAVVDGITYAGGLAEHAELENQRLHRLARADWEAARLLAAPASLAGSN